MQVCLIFLVSLVLGTYATDPNKNVSLSATPLKNTVTSKTLDDKKKDIAATITTEPGSTVTKSTSSLTEASATSTSAPILVPSPQIGKWSINGTNGTIIVLKMAAQVHITFSTTDTKINIPVTLNETHVNGTFNVNNETIKISWKHSASGENSVEFNFNKNEQAKTYSLGSVAVSIDASELPKTNESLKLVHSLEHFNTTLGHSYRCVKLQNFNLTKINDSKLVVGQLKITDFQFQAFKDDKKNNFGLAEDCAFDTSDAVPIVVGCVLAGLVMIVLIAYLVSRRRSTARGYLSM